MESSSAMPSGVRIVFLDIDGVLTNGKYLAVHDRDGWDPNGLDPRNIKALNELLVWTGAKVVISSSWRHDMALPDLRKHLADQGFDGDVIGATPDLGGPRGKEIRAWLDDTDYNVESFVILDDDSDMGDLMPYLVRTAFSVGLSDVEVTAAARILLR